MRCCVLVSSRLLIQFIHQQPKMLKDCVAGEKPQSWKSLFVEHQQRRERWNEFIFKLWCSL